MCLDGILEIVELGRASANSWRSLVPRYRSPFFSSLQFPAWSTRHSLRKAARGLIAALALLLAAGSASAQDEPLSVVLLGDSITYGIMGGTPGIPYADLLSIGLASTHEFTNIGCGGTSTPMWTISEGTNLCLGTQPATIFETFAIPALPADFVTIMLGTNDSVGFFLPDVVTGPEYKKHMMEIVGNSLYFGARTVVMMSPPPKCGLGLGSDPYLRAYRVAAYEICSAHPDVVCGPDIYSVLDSTDFENCGVHPNQQGHSKIAMALGQSLVRHAPIEPDMQVFEWFVPEAPVGAQTLLPVVIYSEPPDPGKAGFDAVAQVNQSTLTFGATGWEDSLLVVPEYGIDGCGPIDVDEDGLPDLVCLFVQPVTGLDLESTEAWLRGRSSIGAAVDVHYKSNAVDLDKFPPHLVPEFGNGI
jgi:lysophospholipase L1-like esterase